MRGIFIDNGLEVLEKEDEAWEIHFGFATAFSAYIRYGQLSPWLHIVLILSGSCTYLTDAVLRRKKIPCHFVVGRLGQGFYCKWTNTSYGVAFDRFPCLVKLTTSLFDQLKLVEAVWSLGIKPNYKCDAPIRKITIGPMNAVINTRWLAPSQDNLCMFS